MATVTDTFNRADSSTVGNDSNGNAWTETNGDWKIASNALTWNGVGDDIDIRDGTQLSSVDHYAQADCTWSATDDDLGVLVRFAGAARTYYRGQGDASNDRIRIFKVVAGSFTLVASQAETIGAETRTVKLTVTGTSLTLTVGAATLNTTDSGIDGTTVGGKYTGCGAYGGSAKTIDNFEASENGAATPSLAGASVQRIPRFGRRMVCGG